MQSIFYMNWSRGGSRIFQRGELMVMCGCKAMAKVCVCGGEGGEAFAFLLG